MHKPNSPVSLTDLSSAGIQLRPSEAVTVVRELVLQVSRGEVAGVPSPHVIRLSPTGGISVEGPVAAGGNTVVRATQLLDALLPPASAGSDFRVPGGLKLVIARAVGTLDLPPFPSVVAFADALSRFAATDPPATVAQLVGSWTELAAARAPSPAAAAAAPVAARVEPFVGTRDSEPRKEAGGASLSVSDIRRARRATGMPLGVIAERSRIPLPLLRELEWGYLMNWPGGHYGHTQLVRYARATGLDEQLVVSTILPMLEETESARASQPHGATSPAAAGLPPAPPVPTAGSRPVVEIAAASGVPAAASAGEAIAIRRPVPSPVLVRSPQALAPRVARRRRSGAIAALAIPALLAIALLPAWWLGSGGDDAAPQPAVVSTSNAAPRAQSSSRLEEAAGRPGAVSPSPGVEQVPGTPAEPAPPAARPPAAPASVAPTQAPGGRAGEIATSPARRQVVEARVGTPEFVQAAHLPSDGVAYSPSFASSGSAMFYHDKDDAKGRAALLRADTNDRGTVLQVTRIVDDNAQNWHVSQSPDGTRIAFDSDRDGERGVYVADANGRNVRRVSPAGPASVPSWSPDSRSLAFVRADPARPKVANLWTLELETGKLRQITDHRVGAPWGGSWFPDGRRIAYSHEDRLVVHDLGTGHERVFASPRKGKQVRTPAVSPDGRLIIFQVKGDGVWLLDTADGSMRKVLEDATAEEYAWSRDGRQVAYHSARAGGWGVWVMAPR